MRERRKFNRIMINVLVIFLALFSLALTIGSQTTARWLVALAQTNESLTITTYYPSPFGSYKELQTQILYFQENIPGPAEGLIAFNYPDAVYDRRLRITAGKADTGIGGSLLGNDQGASVDLHGNNVGGGMSGMLDLVAGAGGDIRFWTSTAGLAAVDRMYILDNGDVGIGKANPVAKLHLEGADADDVHIRVTSTAGGPGVGDRAVLGDIGGANDGALLLYDSTGGGNVCIRGDSSLNSYINGNFGIGTTTPGAKLEVNGAIKVNTVPNLGGPLGPGNFTMVWKASTNEVGRDIAELFETNEDVESGDVLVIAKNGKLEKSSQAYDSKVAGIVSAAPAIVFEGSQLQIAPQPFEFKKGNKPPLALAGRVKCKVTADEGGPIQIGDLLVTSSKPGYAMKADAEKVRVGQVLGKALGALDKGEGEITVLAALQ